MPDEGIRFPTYPSNWFNRHDEVLLLLLVGLEVFDSVAGYRRRLTGMGGGSR
jgi:uncharacterized membrane protein